MKTKIENRFSIVSEKYSIGILSPPGYQMPWLGVIKETDDKYAAISTQSVEHVVGVYDSIDDAKGALFNYKRTEIISL